MKTTSQKSSENSLAETDSENSLAVFDSNNKMESVMLTNAFIKQATSAITNPRNSVELTRSKQIYVPTINRAVKDLGKTSVEAYIKINLAMLNSVLNLARPMSATMIEISAPMIVDHILEDDCTLNLADMKIIFERAMKGLYGNYFNGIGLKDVIGWIDAYIAEKCDEIERWHHNQCKYPDSDRSCSDMNKVKNSFHEAMLHYQKTKQNNQNK